MADAKRSDDVVITPVNAATGIDNVDEYPEVCSQIVRDVISDSDERSSRRRRVDGPDRRGDPNGPESAESQSMTIDLTQDETSRRLFVHDDDSAILPSQPAWQAEGVGSSVPTLEELKVFANRLLTNWGKPFVISDDNRVVLLQKHNAFHGLVVQLLVRSFHGAHA